MRICFPPGFFTTESIHVERSHYMIILKKMNFISLKLIEVTGIFLFLLRKFPVEAAAQNLYEEGFLISYNHL